ncbi:hypothetical protein AgCh_039636 [Apium graveolens]
MGYALRVWEEMGMKGLERDLVAYNTIIGGFCKVGEVKRAEEFFGKMELNGVDGSCVTYEHLVSGYCKIGDVDSALLLYKGMCRKGFRPENFTVDEVINGLCGKNTVSEKLEYLMVAVKKLDSVPKNTVMSFASNVLCSYFTSQKRTLYLSIQTRLIDAPNVSFGFIKVCAKLPRVIEDQPWLGAACWLTISNVTKSLTKGFRPIAITSCVPGIGIRAVCLETGYRCIWSRAEFLCRRDGSPFGGGCRLAVCGKENVATGDIRGSILIPATVPLSLIELSISISDSQLVLGEEYRGDIGAIVASGDGAVFSLGKVSNDSGMVAMALAHDLPLAVESHIFISLSTSPGFWFSLGTDFVAPIPVKLCPLKNLRTVSVLSHCMNMPKPTAGSPCPNAKPFKAFTTSIARAIKSSNVHHTVKAFYQDNVLTVPVDKLPPPEPKKPKIMKVKIS